MFRIVLLGHVVFCFANAFDYHARQGNTSLTALAGNPYLSLIADQDFYPRGIKYLQDIVPSTGLMVRVIFGDRNGPLDPEHAKNMILNVCEILDRELDDPKSAQRRYSMASSLGLEGERCPIKKGTKSLAPYIFPSKFATKDLGCGHRYYTMRIETPNQTFASTPIMELYVDIILTKDNETCIEGSCSAVSWFSIAAGIMATVCIIKSSK